MIFINGYTSVLPCKLGLTPPKGKAYWATDLNKAFFVLKDFNAIFIHPNSNMLSTAKQRYTEGYNYARKNREEIQSHILISGNRLQIVAHSHGVAFAEGLTAFLYEENSFRTDLIVAMQGAQLAEIPQIKRAVRCRLVFTTDGDFIVNRNKQQLKYNNIEIIETCLKNGFCRYRITQDKTFDLPGAEYIYMRGIIPFMKRHCAHRYRQFQVWTAIGHALALYGQVPEKSNIFAGGLLEPEMLKHLADNQN